MPEAAPCKYPRHLSYVTWEYSIRVGYADLTELMDEVCDLWDRVEAEGTTTVIGDGFEALLDHVKEMREYTGWDGVPGKFTR